MLVNLIGYNGYVVTGGDVENVKYMVTAEHGAARIRRIIYNNRRRRLVDLLLQVVQIDLPTELRLETININKMHSREALSSLHFSLFLSSPHNIVYEVTQKPAAFSDDYEFFNSGFFANKILTWQKYFHIFSENSYYSHFYTNFSFLTESHKIHVNVFFNGNDFFLVSKIGIKIFNTELKHYEIIFLLYYCIWWIILNTF